MNSLRFIPRNVLLGVGTAAILSLTVAAQAAEGWVVDFEKAKAQAAKEGKSILMEFTGSDWCPPCKALQKNVLSKDVFKTEMPKSFVLLKLDSPRDKSKQTPEEIEQYKVLSAKYGIQGVPTIFLADAKGRPYYQTVGYSGDPADKYVANLKDQLGTLAKRDAAFAKAEKASGTEKAKLLAEGLSLVDDEMALKTYGNVVSQIIELDADNKAGLKAKFAGLKDSVGVQKRTRSHHARQQQQTGRHPRRHRQTDRRQEAQWCRPAGGSILQGLDLFSNRQGQGQGNAARGAEARAEKRDRQADR